MNSELQEKLLGIQNLCNEILQCIAANNTEDAKRKSWLLHEVICTKFGNGYGKKEEE